MCGEIIIEKVNNVNYIKLIKINHYVCINLKFPLTLGHPQFLPQAEQ